MPNNISSRAIGTFQEEDLFVMDSLLGKLESAELGGDWFVVDIIYCPRGRSCFQLSVK